MHKKAAPKGGFLIEWQAQLMMAPTVSFEFSVTWQLLGPAAVTVAVGMQL
jgi:hypothetical protein